MARRELGPAALKVGQAVAELLPAGPVVVGVSGGADSLALALGAAWAAPRTGAEVTCVVVDHGLQPGSGDIADRVVGDLGDRGLRAEVRRVIVGGDGGIEAAAREARLAALTRDGHPVLLISRGQLDVEAVRRVGISAHELAFKLRAKGVYTVKDVKQAILEQDGQLIITQMDEEKPKYPLITDGVIQHATLEMIDKDEAWLLAALQAQGYAEVGAVFLAEYDSGEITVTGY